jgi:hypothetical protein
MKISDTVMSYEKTRDLNIIADYLPESIRDTAFVWLGQYNIDTGEQEKMLLSRDYVNKMKPEGEIRPALSVYDMLKLIGPSFAITTEMLSTNESFMNNIVDIAGAVYRSTISEMNARPISYVRGAEGHSAIFGTPQPSMQPGGPLFREYSNNDLDL